MKKLLFIPLMLVSINAFADNSVRIAQLKREADTFINKYQKLSQEIKAVETHIYELNGAVAELSFQDESNKKVVKNDKA